MKKILIIVLASCFYGIAQNEAATLPPLITDRPDATEAPNTVHKGYLQIETGGFYTKSSEALVETHTKTYNTTLLRYGISNNFELRVGWNIAETETKVNNQTVNKLNGLSPLLLGMKVGIANENGWIPQIGLIGHLQLPFSASPDYKPETTGVDFRFAFAHTLNDASSLSYNLGAAWGNDSPEATYQYTLAYGYSITNSFGAYIELYGDLPENNAPSHLWDMGLTYILNTNLQLDATLGSGFNNVQDIYLSAGISYRMPLTKTH